MPVTVVEDLRDGLQMEMSESSGIVNRGLTRAFYFKDLPGLGIAKFLSVWNYLGVTLPGDGGPVTIPRSNERIIMASQAIYAKRFEVLPYAEADAELRVGYVNTPLSGFDNVILESGTTYEQDETPFDGEERDKPFLQRKQMYLLYDPGRNARPTDTEQYRKPIRAPVLVGKSFRRFTKTISKDPAPLGERFACRTNKKAWKGYAPETALCLTITGRNAGQGWLTTFDFAIDKTGRFRYVAVVEDPDTGKPVVLRQQDIANRNGIDEFKVQGQADFGTLPI